MNIQDRLFRAIPIKVKSRTDWALPALAGFGVGVALGVGIGLLSAPYTGESARHRLRESASRVRERAADIALKAKRQLSSAGERVEARVAS
jgi:gas vesicle protein